MLLVQLAFLPLALCITLPNKTLDKPTLTSMGIKTIGWQEENEHPQLQIHHNYSKVSTQSQNRTEDFYQTWTSQQRPPTQNSQWNQFSGGQQNVDPGQQQVSGGFNQPQNLGQGQHQVPGGFNQPQNLGQGQQQVPGGFNQQQAWSQGQQQVVGGFDQQQNVGQGVGQAQLSVDQQQQLFEQGQEQFFDQNRGQESDSWGSSLWGNWNGQGFNNALNLEQIMEAEASLQSQQKFDEPPEQFEASESRYPAPNVTYPRDQTVNVHGGSYTPGHEYASVKEPEAYSKCPKMLTGQLVYVDSCNQFLNCWKGRGVVQNCPPGTLFNPYSLECDHAAKVKCFTGPRRTDQTQFSGKLKISCPAGFSGVVPHETDCSKFINCANGAEHVMDCPPGTLFSLSSNLCDYPYKAECAGWSTQFGTVEGYRPKYGKLEEFDEDQQASFGSSGQNGNRPLYGGQSSVEQVQSNIGSQSSYDQSGQNNFGKPSYGQNGSRPPYTGQNNPAQGQNNVGQAQNNFGQAQNTFGQGQTGYQSFYGQSNVGQDQSGNRPPYNGQGQGHNNYGQGSAYGQTEDQSLYGQSNFGQSGTRPSYSGQSNVGQGQNNFGQSPGSRPLHGDQNNPGQQSYGQDEDQVLYGGQSKVDQQTWNGQNFVDQTVVRPSYGGQNAQGQQSYGQQNQHSGGGSQSGQQQSNNQQSHQNYNGHQYGDYQQQSHGGVQPPGSGSYQRPGGYGQGQQQSSQNRAGCPINFTGLAPHGQDCSKFLNCANGQMSIQECGPGTVFNPLTLVCDWPYNVRCQETRFEQSVSENEVKCPPDANGVHPHPSVCNKFLNCAHGQAHVDTCPPGTVFNAVLRVCDHDFNVDCGSKRIEAFEGQHNSIGDSDLDREATGWAVTPPRPGGYFTQATTSKPGGSGSSFGPGGSDSSSRPGGAGSSSRPGGFYVTKPPRVPKTTLPHEEDTQPPTPPPFPGTDTSADYDFGMNEVGPVRDACKTHQFSCGANRCIPYSMVCDGVKDCSSGLDEQNCQKFIQQFALTPNTILAVRENERFVNVSVISCAKACLGSRGFQCRSFSYRKEDGSCFLSDQNVGFSGALIVSHFFDYYEFKALSINCSGLHICPSKKCINRKQICDGVNDCGDRTDERNCPAEVFGYQVKLNGTDKKYEGRVEVKAFGKLGYICDDQFGLRDADVVCRELGFPLGALEVRGNSFYAQDLKDRDVFYLMDDVNCSGNETSLRDCDFNGWGVSNCEPQEVVGVVCKTPLERCPKDHWKCETTHECVPLSFLCDDVVDCADESDEKGKYCDAPIQMRLTNGKSRSEGRVEVRYNGIWGTICDDDFNDDAAKVVCNHLGFPGGAISKKDGYFGPGEGPIWLDQVYCQGNESTLTECVHWDWGEHNCEHDEDVGVACGASRDPNNFEDQHERHQSELLPEYLFPQRCGFRDDDIFLEDDNVHFRVIQGTYARRGDYPWQASLRIKNKLQSTHWCGAIVISQKLVLTAAHCLEGFSKAAYYVVAGDYNTDVDEGSEQEAYIDEFYMHERFRDGQKMNNDIALVKLKGKGFTFTKDVQPICLPDQDLVYPPGQNCTISGFGSVGGGISGYSHTLRAAWIPLLSREVCSMPHVYGDTITDGMVCAGSLEGGFDACDGDSGGPLACLHDGLFHLYGIISWGHHCGRPNKPGVYVNVAHYNQWILDTIRKAMMN